MNISSDYTFHSTVDITIEDGGAEDIETHAATVYALFFPTIVHDTSVHISGTCHNAYGVYSPSRDTWISDLNIDINITGSGYNTDCYGYGIKAAAYYGGVMPAVLKSTTISVITTNTGDTRYTEYGKDARAYAYGIDTDTRNWTPADADVTISVSASAIS